MVAETPKTVAHLIDLLHKRETDILKCIEQEPEAVIQSYPGCTSEARRIDRIFQFENADEDSTIPAILWGLSVVSLADNYIAWEYTELHNATQVQDRSAL
ncbi:hypothetical protein BDV19DRAFT_370443 [Aspergillus venezuelensis]